MFKAESSDWSNTQTGNVADLYQEDFKTLLRDKKNLYKSMKDVSQSFKDHVVYEMTKTTDNTSGMISNLEQVNWSEIATTFVLNYPVWLKH